MSHSAYKFRVSMEEDESVFRDIQIKATQSFADFHKTIIAAFAFDGKHDASFFSCNDSWIKGQEISLNLKSNCKQMDKVPIGILIFDPHQKFIYLYDYDAEWEFLVELVSIENTDDKKSYPQVIRSEGAAPKQYGNQLPVGGVPDDGVFEEKLDYDSEENFEGGEEGEDTGDEENNDADGEAGEDGDDEFGGDDNQQMDDE